MRLDWAVVCWALSSLYHDWRTSSSTLSSVEVQLLREDLSTTRTVLADLEEGHLTCGWRLRFSGWILQASLVIHLATLAWCLGHRFRRRTPEAPPLAIAGAGSADSEEGDSSPNTGVSSVSRASSGLDMGDYTLNISEVQLLVNYPADADDIIDEIYAHDEIGQADVRLLGDHKDAAGRRRLELPLAVSLMRQHEEEGFPIAGTRASLELHEAVAAGAGNFVSYHAEWIRLSGVSRKSSAAIVHQSLCEVLRLAHFYDQIDSSSLACLEHVARWLIQVELAVGRNPQQPNYEGLDILTGLSVSSDGRATTSKFAEWVSNRMKDRANIWRQERLFKQGALAGEDLEFTSLPRRMDECLRCLNELAAVPFHSTTSEDRYPLTDVQKWIFSDLARRELCSEESLYSQEAAHLADFDSKKVKIL
ncbi:unnamed protein product [Effrenium voratum]|nr:unnamed protein product [Effrenium voratum]